MAIGSNNNLKKRDFMPAKPQEKVEANSFLKEGENMKTIIIYNDNYI